MTVKGISDRSRLLLSSGFAALALIFLAAAQEMAVSAENFAHGVNPFVPPAIQSFVIGFVGRQTT
jgi:hypothetical protein